MNKKEIKATLTVGDKTVDMDDKPAADKLMGDMITQIIPEFKGGKMGGIRIEIKRAEEITIKPKNNKVVISMLTYLTPGDIGRLFHLAGQGVPVSAVIESPQAEFDLVFTEVNTFTGEVRTPAPAVYSAGVARRSRCRVLWREASTLSMRRPSRSTTSKRQPCAVMISPQAGRWPRWARMKPPTVS